MTQTTTLGSCIRMERKKAGLTQAQLGKLIGLGESRVSKIENGAPITPETASFILNKLGSDIQIQVVNKRLEAESINFIMETILNFARTKSISLASAFKYLNVFKGISYLRDFMDIERTLSSEDITRNLSRICANNGGNL